MFQYLVLKFTIFISNIVITIKKIYLTYYKNYNKYKNYNRGISGGGFYG